MAIDSQSETQTQVQLEPADTGSASVIENEFPTYRAVSARAVTSVILGMASVFCFTSLWFLLLAAVAVVFGWVALRTIKRLPEILTGSGLAKTGIGLALVFGLTALTRTVVENAVLTYGAGQFSKGYVEILKSQPLATALWYKQSTAYRKEKTPDQLIEELKGTKSPGGADQFSEESGPVLAIKEVLKKPNTEIHFSAIESNLVDGLTHYANALIDIDTPDGEKFALLQLIKDPGSGFSDWRVREINFPYKPASTGVLQEKKEGDDGHGHSH